MFKSACTLHKYNLCNKYQLLAITKILTAWLSLKMALGWHTHTDTHSTLFLPSFLHFIHCLIAETLNRRNRTAVISRFLYWPTLMSVPIRIISQTLESNSAIHDPYNKQKQTFTATEKFREKSFEVRIQYYRFYSFQRKKFLLILPISNISIQCHLRIIHTLFNI